MLCCDLFDLIRKLVGHSDMIKEDKALDVR